MLIPHLGTPDLARRIVHGRARRRWFARWRRR